MGKNTSISLGNYFENFINSEIISGKYASASEVIRTALRLLEMEEQKTKELRNALELGENSKIIENFNPNISKKAIGYQKLNRIWYFTENL